MHTATAALPAGALSHHPLRPPPQVRLQRAGDARLLAEYLQALSPASRALRADAQLPGSGPERVLVASLRVDGGERLVGEARYRVAADGRAAALALSVADAWRGTGVATQLMERLLLQAADDGLHRLHAQVPVHHRRMLAFMQRRGFTREAGDGAGRDAAGQPLLRMGRCVQAATWAPELRPAQPAATGQPMRYGAVWACSHWLKLARACRWVGAWGWIR